MVQGRLELLEGEQRWLVAMLVPIVQKQRDL